MRTDTRPCLAKSPMLNMAPSGLRPDTMSGSRPEWACLLGLVEPPRVAGRIVQIVRLGVTGEGGAEQGGPAVVGGPGGVDVGQVLVGPLHEAADRVEQGAAHRRERVVDPGRDGRVHRAGDEPVAFQPAQGDGEHALADAVDYAAQVAEPSPCAGWNATGSSPARCT